MSTKCKELIMGVLEYVRVKDISIHDMKGTIIGNMKAYVPTVFQTKWPEDINADMKTKLNLATASPTPIWR